MVIKTLAPTGLNNTFSCSIISGGESVQVEISEYKAKALIVDDDLEVAEEMLDLLTSEDFLRCEIAEDEVRAMDIVKSDRDISIIITNLKMPGLDGLQIIEKLRDVWFRDRDFAIIVITDCDEPKKIIRALQLGAMEVVARPVSPDHLLQVVGRASAALHLRQLVKANLEARAHQIGLLSDDPLPSDRKLQSPALELVASHRTRHGFSSTVGDNPKAAYRRLKNSVLIVDDDIDALEEMEESLKGHGLTVYTASNVDLALKTAKEQHPKFIIMDYLLRGYTGINAINEIHKFLPETQVIMISASDDLAGLVTTADFGVVAVLKKPLSIDTIARFLKNKLSYKRKVRE
jgi:DNA-binding NtrC family response regulator